MMDFHKHPTTNGYTLDHTTFTYLIDAQGKVRLMAGDRQPSEWLAQDIRLLLASAR